MELLDLLSPDALVSSAAGTIFSSREVSSIGGVCMHRYSSGMGFLDERKNKNA